MSAVLMLVAAACSAHQTPRPAPITGDPRTDTWLMVISHDARRTFVEVGDIGGWWFSTQDGHGGTTLPGGTYPVTVPDSACRPLHTFAIGSGLWLLRIRDGLPVLTQEDDLDAGPGLANPRECEPG